MRNLSLSNLGIFVAVVCFGQLTAQTLPNGFTAVQIATGIANPVAMTFAPDGRIFITEQGGAVRVFKNGTLLSTPLIQLKVNTRGESGLIGIVLDPNFSSNQYMYLYYTLPDGSRDRISRFKCNGDLAALSTGQVILDLDVRAAGIHHGGAMHFKDGKLFVAIGDASNGANAQNLDTYHGKVIRINADGSIPSGNPYTSGSEQRRRIWAHGLRNPFTFSIQPGTGRILVNDVGLETWEEINDVTLPGKNFGWPEAQGNSTNPAFTNPLYAYDHGKFDEFGCAISGGTFFNPTTTNYPAAYKGRYFFQDFCSQWMRTIDLSTSPVRNDPFGSGVGANALYITTGNDGNLYYLTRGNGSLYKILYTSLDAPQILKHPASLSVSAGQPASFSVTASGKSPLMYQWRKNGVNITGATGSTYGISQTTTSHAGFYSVKVSNSIGSVVSNSAQLTITAANDRPVAQILQPATGSLYRAGDIISFSGTATDKEDGDLPASKFTWIADFHHDTHRHDGPPVGSGTKAGSFTIPTQGETSDNVWYRLYLIVSDSQGSSDTASVDILPRKSTITLTTQPAGLKVKLDDQPLNTPLSTVSVENFQRTIGAVSPQQFNGKTFVFEKWLHGGAEAQTVFTPVDDVTYTAVYNETPGAIKWEVWNGITGSDVSVIPIASAPDQVIWLANFESTADFGHDYGSRIRGYIYPPVSGNYTFWIASDDRSELWLSKDDVPANKIRIASVGAFTAVRQWDKYSGQRSATIALVGGEKYYIEALHKESTGLDHVAVGWQLPNGTLERPVPGSRLSPFGVPTITITSPKDQENFTTPASVNFAATASDSDGTIARVEFYNGVAKLAEDATSPYSFNWTNVPAGSYSLTAKAIDNSGAWANASVDITVTSGSSCAATGSVENEVWTGISGTLISSIPVTSAPSTISNITSFEVPANVGDNYGRRVRGYLCVPTTGNYFFWIASDDNGELWLSTDENPANKSRIAHVAGWTQPRQWDKYSSQKSGAVSLIGGRRYYFEALMKEGTGGDHLAVGWQLPGGGFERPIPGGRLIKFSTMACSGTGTVQQERWTGIPGLSISSIPVNSSPSVVSNITSLEVPTNVGDNYGSRVRGYFCAPKTGYYFFWIASDDTGELWLSTDENPVNKKRIAYAAGWTQPRQWDKYGSQKSAGLNLVAGRKYYFEALMKEGTGGDHLAVGWQLPGGALERPVPGMRLLPFATQESQAVARMTGQTPASVAVSEIITNAEEREQDENGLQIYPNPVSKGIAELIMPTLESTALRFHTKIYIQGITGETVFSESRVSHKYERYYSIPTLTFPSGVYLVTVICNGTTFSKRMLVR